MLEKASYNCLKAASELSECGPGYMSGNVSCCASSLLTFGVVTIEAETDGASYEHIISEGT